MLTVVNFSLGTSVFSLALAFPACVVSGLQSLVFSLAGLILAKAIGVNIKYAGILRIASFALGNVILIDGFLQIFPIDIPEYGLMEISIPNWFFFKFVLALGFTLFGVGANLSAPSFQSVSESSEPVSLGWYLSSQ